MRSLALCTLLLAGCSHATPETPAPAAAAAKPDEALASFELVRGVLQSPRCVVCHPRGDRPLQGDDLHVHLQNVQRGPKGQGAVGLACATCHGTANLPASYGPDMPPGVSTGWEMTTPQTKMVFERMSPRALCEQLKDPKRNGGRDMAALTAHMSSPLVLWGWAPGTGRAPVSVPHARFLAAFKAWAAQGAPCPAN
jgi:hypothetical protein